MPQRHLLTENRNGLIVDARSTRAHGNVETLAAVDMLAARPPARAAPA